MKKNLLTAAALVAMLSAKAQFITYVGNTALVTVQQDALVYSGGGIQTVGTGLIDNSGNVMMNGGSFQTTTDGTTPKTDGGNFILRLTDKTNFSTYGQFYLTGAAQSAITGIVDKEYLDVAHGAYQQAAIPFYAKTISSLSTDLGASFADNRWTQAEVLSYDNANVISNNLPLTATTISAGTSTAVYNGKTYGSAPYANKNTTYYQLGTKGWKANAPVSGSVFTVKGVPFADGISETLAGAGSGVSFGALGINTNAYKEKYSSYVQPLDPWTLPAWVGNFGKNVYQFGNPFLTNLDLSAIVGELTADDGNNITNLIGIRYGVDQAVWNTTTGSSTSTVSKFVSFVSGTAIGDKVPVIKPMGVFSLKLADGTSQTLNFDKLRRFKYTNRAVGISYDVSAAKASSNVATTLSARSTSAKAGASVKQLGLIALGKDGKEIGRTYYAVYPTAVTGYSETQTTQVQASTANVIGSFEEAKTGGADQALKDTYWLYINVANDSDFKNKEVPVRVYADDVASLKVELKENGEEVSKNLTNGESFYVVMNGKNTAVSNGETLPLTAKELSVSYGLPNNQVLATTEALAKPSATVVVLDEATSTYKILFDNNWKTADVAVYDMAGKQVLNVAKANASTPYTLALPNTTGVYVVTAVSEKGQKFVQKIKK